MKLKKIKNNFLKFWKWTWNSDSILSYFSAIILSIIIIKFLIFPFFGLILKNDFPMVVVVTGSMEHKIVDGKICENSFSNDLNKNLDFEKYWNSCGNYYENNLNISKKNFENFEYNSGLNIGDALLIYGKKENYQVGEVLIFIPKDKNFFQNYGPVIHRIVKIENNLITTKGDHNPFIQKNFEDNLSKENIIGKPILKIPYLGYPKLFLAKILGIV